MTVVVETGSGTRGANSYVDVAYVTTYLTARNRQTAWAAKSTPVQEAAVIGATDYIEKRFGDRFKGVRAYTLDEIPATGSVAFTGVPSNAETLQVSDETYAFVTSLSSSPAVRNEILIAASAAVQAQSFLDALLATAAEAGVTHGAGTLANRHVDATLESATVFLEAVAYGAGGNSTVLSGAVTNATLTALSGGLDGGSQPLSFPRAGLYGYDGRIIYGVPERLRQAAAEYADRAQSATLAPDPNVDDQGGSIKRLMEKVGPIQTDTEYVSGTHLGMMFRPYPAADRLLAEYLTSVGVTR